jgi:hypothetical protein
MFSPPITIDKSWTTDDGSFTFNYEFTYGVSDDMPLIKVTIVSNASSIIDTSPTSNPFTLTEGNKSLFSFECEDGNRIKGSLNIVPLHNPDSLDKLAVWSDVYFGEEFFNHFEGLMITFQSDVPGIIISAHGGRWSDQAQNLRIPAGSSIVYYVNDGQILSNYNGYQILSDLQNAVTPRVRPAQQLSGGQSTYDYSCWYAPEFAADCGIFMVGSDQLVEPLNQYTEDNPLLLSQIFQSYPQRTIYWDCCREISDRTITNVLKNTPGAFLNTK